MQITTIKNLIMDDTCKSSEDIFNLAFYGIGNFEIEKKISLNTLQTNCKKYRINDLNWLKDQPLDNLPDVIVMRPDTKLTDEQLQMIVNLNIKVSYVDESILSNDAIFQKNLGIIERTIYKSKTLKYFKSIKNRLEQFEKEYSNEINNNIVIEKLIDNYLEIIKEKDVETYNHSINVSKYIDIYLDGLDEKLNGSQISFLKKAALVHDIGKIMIPNPILKKSSALTDGEYAYMQNHTAFASVLFNNKLLGQYKEIVLCHHERYDGRGYPNGLKGKNIPYAARVISVIGAFEAMTGNSEYKKAEPQKSLFEILKDLKENAGTQFDPDIVNAFIKGVVKNPSFQQEIEDKRGNFKCA